MPDVARFTKLRGIGLDERYTNETGDAAQQVRLTHARGTKQQDVVLGILAFLQFRFLDTAADVVVMVTDRHGEDLLRLALLNHKPVQIIAHIARLEVKLADALKRIHRLLVIVFGHGRFGRRRLRRLLRHHERKVGFAEHLAQLFFNTLG